jgi:hypothetical protein
MSVALNGFKQLPALKKIPDEGAGRFNHKFLRSYGISIFGTACRVEILLYELK